MMVKSKIIIFVSFLFSVLTSCVAAEKVNGTMISDIKRDEFVVFFRTSAWMSDDNQYWYIPIHGWIYEPEKSTLRKALIAKSLSLKFGLEISNATEANFERRVNLLIADNERNKRIVVRIGERNHVLPPSAENGHFKHVIRLPMSEVNNTTNDGSLVYSAVTKPTDLRLFTGEVRLVTPVGLSIISDIDDTIKITQVTKHEKLFEHTFYNDFTAAPGMASLYQSWADDTMLHFVSSSPWQLYSPLLEFVQQEGFPWATLSLKSVRFRDETLLNLFKKGTETKPAQIEPILTAYPKRKFILIGDSGEQDPEVYAGIARKYGSQIVKIYIRNVSGAASSDERFKQAFNELSHDQWQLFTDPATLNLIEFVYQ